MQLVSQPSTRPLTIIAQDPQLKHNQRIVRAEIEVPAEAVAPGPIGYRVHVIDYDASTDTHYGGARLPPGEDPFLDAEDQELLDKPEFHCQNVYALVMRTLARFELALGRRVGWGFYGHQLKVAPHAFADANAFYSEEDHALLFGYFPAGRRMVFTSLSHDVIVHEATHALLDGLRERYTDPSSPDQAAFHEGFADVVALLSVFSLPSIVEMIVEKEMGRGKRISAASVTPEKLRKSILFGLAEEVGQELEQTRGQPLRQSVKLEPSTTYLKEESYEEPHLRGEILVAAMINAFIEVWSMRIMGAGSARIGLQSIADEGARIADVLLTAAIRALDYAPPVDLTFGDYLSALVTGDAVARTDEGSYPLRGALVESFRNYGIKPKSRTKDGTWPQEEKKLKYDCVNFESMQRDPHEVFRFLWENRMDLGVSDRAYTRVLSVRPSVRIGQDGFALRETVCEYLQVLRINAAELRKYKIRKPVRMEDGQEVTLYGGGALIFDQYGKLRYHVDNPLEDADRQQKRLDHLWRSRFFSGRSRDLWKISQLHRRRALGDWQRTAEEW